MVPGLEGVRGETPHVTGVTGCFSASIRAQDIGGPPMRIGTSKKINEFIPG